MSLNRLVGKRAIVIGGSIAGKLSARVLSDFFEEVIVLEKDQKNDSIAIRKGVPQGSQGHVLLKSGEEIIEELFPGIIAEMVMAGSTFSDFSRDLVWFHHGCQKNRFNSGLSIIQQSRPFLEWNIQKRMEKIPNIDFRYGCKVNKLFLNEKKEISGVTAEKHDGRQMDLAGDLVVDASGAASLTSKWLEELGFKKPKKTEVKVDLFYASMIFEKLAAGTSNWHSLLVYPNPPKQSRGGTISPIEGDRHLVTLLGYGVEHLPSDHSSFLQYAKNLDQPDLYEAIITAVPETGIQMYRFPALRRFHYDKLKQFPAGLLVMGDSFCRIDPVFAQGMSIAAMEAEVLRKMLKSSKTKEKLTKDFHRKISKIIDIPWLIALTEDFRFQHTSGKKPFGLSILQMYVKNVVLACSHNEKVYRQFMNVLHLKAHPVSLFKPAILNAVFPFLNKKV
ncbi:glutamate synthase subunit beta [Bacillus sp. JJ1609]|uniref:FAD-dependent oxidoreductase n=1 Tax=Bacillus sp. JJ1609 TaxID=3122977 RepID=UPI002FFE9696